MSLKISPKGNSSRRLRVMKCCSLQYISWTWVLKSPKSKPASRRNLLRISWISKLSATKGDLITLLFATPKNLLQTYLYKFTKVLLLAGA